MPVQDFGNAFSTFVAQNFGAGQQKRIRQGIRSAIGVTTGFCLLISAIVFIFARPLMQLFIDGSEKEIISIGVEYLRVEGSFYVGIGYLFLLYGFYRAIRMPGMSVVLTVFSLGTRVVLAYALAAIPAIGVHGIWWSIPIGWALADAYGVGITEERSNAVFGIQDMTLCEVLGSSGIDVHHAPSFDGINQRTGDFLWNSRTSETSSQSASCTDD